jgi:hypothetical protein
MNERALESVRLRGAAQGDKEEPHGRVKWGEREWKALFSSRLAALVLDGEGVFEAFDPCFQALQLPLLLLDEQVFNLAQS